MTKLVLLGLLAASAMAVPMPDSVDLQANRDLDCLEQEDALFSCMFVKAATTLNRAALSSDIEFFDGVKFVRETPMERSGKDLKTEQDIMNELPRDASDRAIKLVNMLYESTMSFIKSHSLKLSMPEDASISRALDEVSRHCHESTVHRQRQRAFHLRDIHTRRGNLFRANLFHGFPFLLKPWPPVAKKGHSSCRRGVSFMFHTEGRGKIKKMILPIVAAVAVKLFALVPILLGGLGLLVVKALFVGKIALLVAGVLAFQRLFGAGNKGPANIFSKNAQPAWIDNGSQGWSSGAVAQQQGYYKRSFENQKDAHDMAYAAQAPTTNEAH